MIVVESGVQMSTNEILVTYASRAGSTAGVAEAIAEALRQGGLAVTVRAMQAVDTLEPYRAVVAGSAVHGGKWLPEAVRFIRRQRTALAARPCALFLVCMALTMKQESARQGVTSCIDPLRAVLRPVSVMGFAGALDLARLPLVPDRLVSRALVASGLWALGDHRDWDAIRSWSERIRPLLL